VDPGSFDQYPRAARTGGEHVITADGQAHHGGINRIAAGQQHSARLSWAVMTPTTRFADQASPAAVGAGRVIKIKQTGDCTNRHDPLPSSRAPLTGDLSCMICG
jgi:hypothetical protein